MESGLESGYAQQKAWLQMAGFKKVTDVSLISLYCCELIALKLKLPPVQILCLLRHYPVVGIANVASSERVEKKNHSIGVVELQLESTEVRNRSLFGFQLGK